jgi:hypothetical protein
MHDAAPPAPRPHGRGQDRRGGPAVKPALHAVPDPIGFLLGSWSTRRHLLDRSTNTAGTFAGTTTFTADAGGLHWLEEGRVRWPTFEGPASRSYRIARGIAAGVEVLFEDGRLLCRLDLTGGRARDQHECTPDTYVVDFTVRSSDSIEYRWDVTGPAKDLLLTTALSRSGVRTHPER